MINRTWMLSVRLTVLLMMSTGAVSVSAQSWPEGVIGGLQHSGAVHIYANPGPLAVDVYKRDLKTNTDIDRTATVFLTGPDGSILAEERIASPPGQWGNREGPLQHISFKVDILHAGVYTVLITGYEDPYLRRSQVWGFCTNADKCLINSSTGHTDTQRAEPIMLYGERQPISIFFKPTSSTLNIDVDQLPANAGMMELRDPNDKIVWQFTANSREVTTGDINTTDIIDGIWELKMPVTQGKIYIKGLNHEFEKGKNVLPVWTTSRDRYFDLENLHWLLSPRRQSRNLESAFDGTMSFSLFNNSEFPVTYDLQVHPEAGFLGKAEPLVSKLQIAPKTADTVRVAYQLDQDAPEGAYRFNLMATDPNTKMQAFSLAELRQVKSDTSTPITLPIQFELFGHDQFQFAYTPDYPRGNEFYFDVNNNPWVVTSDGLQTWKNGKWHTVLFSGYHHDEVDFKLSALGTDKNGYVYAIAYLKQQPHMIRVSSEILEADIAPLPKEGVYSIEISGTSIDTHYPPAIVRQIRDRTKKNIFKKAAIHEVELIIPEVRHGKLHVPPAIKVSSNGHGVSQHSGRPNLVVSDEEAVHLVWGEIVSPGENAPGVPVYTVSYDRKNTTLSEKIFIAHAPPVNDAHNTSSILMDSQGNRHIITGTHNRPFIHRMTKSGEDRWSSVEYVSDLEQTYVGAMPDQSGGIHLLYRIWQRGQNFPGLFQTALYYQHKAGSQEEWSRPRPFALPALPAYSIYRHRVTRDRRGFLYVNMEYWSTWAPYRETYRTALKSSQEGKTRINLISEDNGVTWRILRGDDLRRAAQLYQ